MLHRTLHRTSRTDKDNDKMIKLKAHDQQNLKTDQQIWRTDNTVDV